MYKEMGLLHLLLWGLFLLSPHGTAFLNAQADSSLDTLRHAPDAPLFFVGQGSSMQVDLSINPKVNVVEIRLWIALRQPMDALAFGAVEPPSRTLTSANYAVTQPCPDTLIVTMSVDKGVKFTQHAPILSLPGFGQQAPGASSFIKDVGGIVVADNLDAFRSDALSDEMVVLDGLPQTEAIIETKDAVDALAQLWKSGDAYWTEGPYAFPNPAQATCRICNLGSAVRELRIVTPDGRQVGAVHVTPDLDAEIRLDGLAPGVYLVQPVPGNERPVRVVHL